MKSSHIIVAALAAACGWIGALVFQHPADSRNSADSRKILLYQCPMHPWVKSDKPGRCTVCGMELVPVYEKARAASRMVFQTAEVKSQPLLRTLRVSGMIGEDESRHGVISAPVEGRIDGLAMSCEGDKMTRRQPFATIFSRTLLAAASDYKLALEQGGAAESKRKLEQYGLVWEQIKTIPTRQPDDLYFGILAPLTGTIVKSYVSEGQYVRQGDKLFEIADFTRMWFVFTASEQDLALIEAGQSVTLTTPSLPGQTLKSKVAFISPNLDELTHSANVRVVLENPERRIKNKIYAAGTVAVDAPEVLAIPRGAVLWRGALPRVYVERTPGAFEPRDVMLGRAGDLCWEVLGGLQESERVVTTGNILLDSQMQIEGALPQFAPKP